MDAALLVLIFLVGVALLFDFLNGLHDAANSIATIVSTRVLKPHWAVFWAGFFNFIAFAVFGTAVAKTVGSGIISPDAIDNGVIFGALVGAITWNVATWLGGIPSSSSHALIGGLIGAGVAKAGFDVVVMKGVIKTGSGIFMAPAIGFSIALFMVLVVSWLFVKARPNVADSVFRKLQFVSAAAYSIGHGGNDAQKTMGIIAALLIANGAVTVPAGEDFAIPFWVVITCQAAIGLGTLFGGWRIVKTMGSKITKLSPMQGFCAETGGAITLFMATHFGIPVSTTHTITGSIIGVGAAKRVSAVRWGIAQSIVFAWFVTIPAAALVGALFYWLWSAVAG